MTPEQLAEIKARAEVATPTQLDKVGYDAKPYQYHTWRVVNEQGYALAINCTSEDADLYARARADVLALIAEIERLNSRIDTLLKRWRIFAKEPCVKAHVRQLVSDMADDLEFATKDGEG